MGEGGLGIRLGTERQQKIGWVSVRGLVVVTDREV